MNSTNDKHKELATFAGGCFWCMVSPFEEMPGILKVVSGYTGGHKDNPTYEEVYSETTGHREAVQITFNPEVFPYDKLLDIYWSQIDPTDPGGQFNDRGESYRTAIYYHNEDRKNKAESSKRKIAESGRFNKPIVTDILRHKHSIQQRIIIRTIIELIRSAIKCIAEDPAGINSLNSTGSSRRIRIN